MSRTLHHALSLAAAAVLVGSFWWQGERFIAANGPTFDEGAHLAAGYSYWMTGDFRMNREHPPLLKLLWAAPLAASDRTAYPYDVAAATDGNHWHVAAALLYQPGADPIRTFAPARRMNLALGCCVVLLAGWSAFRVWGSHLAGVAACAFAAFDPTLVALSCVLSTDLGLALFSLLTVYLVWEYSAAPTRGLLVAAGMSLGCLLGSKFSAVAVVAGLGTAGLVYVLRGGLLVIPGKDVAPDLRSRLRAAAELAFRIGLIALVTLAATYAFVAFDNWGAGLKFQLTRGEFGDGFAYLNGDLSRTGWYHYFLVVLPLKLPLGLILAAASGIVVLFSHCLWGREQEADRRVWLLVPPLVVLAAASVARVNLGVRVVLPAIPFLYILAARLAVPGCCQRPRFALLGCCLAWVGFAGWQASPHQLAYFNELADGSTGGLRYAADSNLDWGQGLPQVKQYMDRERIDAVYLSYFGTDRPEAHGIRFQPLPGYGRVGDPGGERIPLEAPRHVVVVSANHLVGLMLNDPDTFAWLRSRPPTAILGGSLYVYDLTGDPNAIRRVRALTPATPE